MKDMISYWLCNTFLSFILLMGITTSCKTGIAGKKNISFNIKRFELGHQTSSVSALDLNSDGWLDLVLTGGGKVTVLEGNELGEFRVAEVIGAGENPVHFDIGDLDLDGNTDLVIANHETHYLTLIFGGHKGFGSGRTERFNINISPHPHAVALADVDEDMNLDIVVDDRDREQLRVYLGNGNGTFEEGISIAVGGDPYRGMDLSDLNNDQHLDVITPNPHAVDIRYGDGTGIFTPGTRLDSRDIPPFNTTVGDFNNDGIMDIAAGSGEGPGALVLWLGVDRESYMQAPGSPFTIAEGPTRLKTGDINSDGTDDILVTSYIGNELAIVFGGKESFHVSRIDLDDNPWDVAAGDFNNDGAVDLVIANDGGTYINIFFADQN